MVGKALKSLAQLLAWRRTGSQAGSRAAGARFELRAQRFLERQGLRLLERNYNCRHGEIDLIMLDGEELVFVEVRMRSSANFGGAALSVNSAKKRKIRKSIGHYLARYRVRPPLRFDLIAFEADSGSELRWWRAVDL